MPNSKSKVILVILPLTINSHLPHIHLHPGRQPAALQSRPFSPNLRCSEHVAARHWPSGARQGFSRPRSRWHVAPVNSSLYPLPWSQPLEQGPPACSSSEQPSDIQTPFASATRFCILFLDPISNIMPWSTPHPSLLETQPHSSNYGCSVSESLCNRSRQRSTLSEISPFSFRVCEPWPWEETLTHRSYSSTRVQS